ncbi:MAG: glycosyltransferase family 4 protein [Candidatus Omnitrophica bacterium]|nr:glycosyltransferase family 4 protein [Candidatus Omnitrophota bacterium]MDD5591969.1 glycosyltransferase family 4 protein [Candidatus Omnitrophota bacterium]
MSNLSEVKAIVVTHATISMPSGSEVYGQCHAIADFLKENARELIFIRHPLEGRNYSRAELFTHAGTRKLKIIATRTQGALRYAIDILSTVAVVFTQRGKWDIFIGVNSLNAFSGLLLKRLGKVKRVIFYTADYVPQRFADKRMNSIYHWFDRFCIKQADFVWNISQAQMEIRKNQGLPGNKNIYVPHGIDKRHITHQPLEKVDRYSFVVAANLSRAFNYRLIIDAFKDVAVKVPQAKLIIIGTGELEKEISDYIRLNRIDGHVLMLGWMPHDKLIPFISRCGIGLAIYTSLCSWTNFSDSFKTKEYLGCGCPVIISGALGAIREAQTSNAIIAVGDDKNSLYEAMLKLLEEEDVYLQYRNNAINFMQDLDWQKIYSRSLSPIFNQ